MTTEREALINEANELGLEFAKNVKTQKLVEMIAEAKGEPVPVDEVVPPGPKMKKEEPEGTSDTPSPASKRHAAHMKRAAAISEAKAKAFKTRIVTLTNKDNREAEHVTTVYLSFENQYFGLSRIVPLDVPVELEEALIHIAENTLITLHKSEIIDGKPTGNKVPVRVKKFAISYSDQKPK